MFPIARHSPSSSSTVRVLQKLWPLMWPSAALVGPTESWRSKTRILAAVGLLVGGKMLNIQVPFLLKEAIDVLNPLAAVDSVTVAGGLLLGYTAARIGAVGCNELKNAIFARTSTTVQRVLARNTFAHLHSLGHAFHTQRNPGALSTAIDRGLKYSRYYQCIALIVRGVSFIFTATVFNLAPTAVEVALVTGLLTWQYGLGMGLVALGTVSGYTAFTVRVSSWRTRYRRSQNRAEAEASSLAYDSLQHHEAVKQLGHEARELAAYDRALAAYQQASLQSAHSLAWLNLGQAGIVSGGLGLAMWLMTGQIGAGMCSVGDLALVNGLLLQLALPLNFLGAIYREMRQAMVDVDEGLLRLQAIQPELGPTGNLQIGSDPLIVFEAVSFGYDGANRILDSVSFAVPWGKKVAIVGASGCGKSTIARLLFRLVEPSQGRILIDGRPISEYSLSSLRSNLCLVPQDPAILNRSIFDNIAYGAVNPDAVTFEQVVLAAQHAQLADLIEGRRADHKDHRDRRDHRKDHTDDQNDGHKDNQTTNLHRHSGYDAMLGDRGIVLSGGERQRFSLARLLIRAPPILILDEATSALDPLTERAVLGAMEEALPGRTWIVIAHRLASIRSVDQILVLEAGRIVEQGSHDELIAWKGIYHRLWMAQEQQEQNK